MNPIPYYIHDDYGVFLHALAIDPAGALPANGTINPPPFIPNGCWAVYSGGDQWALTTTRQAAPLPDLEITRDRIKEAIKAHGLAVRRQGFPWNFGTPENPDVQMLQLRAATPDNDDEKNWGISLSGYTAMVMIGMGDQPGAKFRTEANQTFTVTYQQGLNILLSMQGYCSGLFNISWLKQGEADAAPDLAALAIVEASIANGWS